MEGTTRRYACMHFEKLKLSNPHDIVMRYEHVARTKYAENVDAERSHLNRTIIDDKLSWVQSISKRRDELGYGRGKGQSKLRKDAVIGLEFVTQFSPGALSDEEIDKWVDANVQWFNRTYGMLLF